MMLKRIFSAALAAALLLAMTACGGSKEPPVPTLKEGVTLQQVIDQVNESYPVAMSAAVDETVLTDLLGQWNLGRRCGGICRVHYHGNGLLR